jgi:hypothetical protein
LRNRDSRIAAAFGAGAGLVYLLGLAPLNVHDRLLVPLAPLFLVFLGHGLAGLVGFASRRGRPRAALPVVLAGILAAAGVSATALRRAGPLPYGDDPPVQKEAGEWLARRYDRGIRMMTPSPAIAFYFYDAARQDNEVDLPWAPWEDVRAFARGEGVAVLAAPEWHLLAVGHPAAAALLGGRAVPGLEPLAVVGRKAPYRVWMWRLAPEPSR